MNCSELFYTLYGHIGIRFSVYLFIFNVHIFLNIIALKIIDNTRFTVWDKTEYKCLYNMCEFLNMITILQ